ncbi:hypothetical protein [Moorena sp. SIO4G3]|uniref:hypothetical protein n=1 Tax=Moorena sp. SIO4G3 TaxID=2607821 RepID=UPI0014298179|nr:hypothetical protein [Moorena sp. SIO4G3]NEO80423.1 hypothetical protein [Moorena sp. SIO4G3]
MRCTRRPGGALRDLRVAPEVHRIFSLLPLASCLLPLASCLLPTPCSLLPAPF